MQFSNYLVYFSVFALGVAVSTMVKTWASLRMRGAYLQKRPTIYGDRYNILKIDHGDELPVVHSS